MLLLSFSLLLLAALLGGVLAALHLRAGRMRPLRRPLWALHGLLGLSGFGRRCCSACADRRAAWRWASAGFGRVAAILLALALLAGAEILFERLRHHRLPVLMVGLHATIAIGGSGRLRRLHAGGLTAGHGQLPGPAPCRPLPYDLVVRRMIIRRQRPAAARSSATWWSAASSSRPVLPDPGPDDQPAATPGPATTRKSALPMPPPAAVDLPDL